MKHQQHHQRQRGRGRKPGGGGGGGGHNNPNRSFESTGPDIKVRGSASHIYEKYLQLARDANSSGDRVMAESYLQHAEHYFRIVRAMQPAYQPPASAEQRFDQRFGNDADFDESEDAAAPAEAMAGERTEGEAIPGEGEQPSIGGYGQERGRPEGQRFEGQRFEGEGGDRDDFRRGRRGRRGRFRPDGEPRPESENGEYREARDYREPREPREPREAREPREEGAPREERMERPYREPREPRAPREPRQPREAAEPAEGFADSPKPAFLAGE